MTTSTPPESWSTPAFASVKTSNLSPTTLSWLHRVLYALDQKDVESYCAFMSPNVTLTFNNGVNTQPNTSGIEAVKAALAGFWQTFKSIRHEELCMFESESGRVVMHEALNHYETSDGRTVTLRAVAIMERDERGLIEALRIYCDQSPLFQG